MKDSTNTQVAQWAQSFPALAARGIDESTWGALKGSIFPGAKDESIIMAVDYCRSRKLDIMMKPVHIVPMNVKDAQTGSYGYRDVVMPGVGSYRIQAERSGNYAGADAIEYGPMVDGKFIDKNGKEVTCRYPEYATMTVYKQMPNGNRVGFSVTEYWDENYATDSGKSNAPNAMWLKRPRAQLAKCVEAQCLRRAWPEIGQEVTAEEMEGKHERDVTPPAQKLQHKQAEPQTAVVEDEGMKPFPDALFEQRKALWISDIEKGVTTFDAIASFVQSKNFMLTPMQQATLTGAN